MNKLFSKVVYTFLILVTCLLCVGSTSNASFDNAIYTVNPSSNYRALVMDSANLFVWDFNCEMLLEQLEPLTDYCNLAIITSDDIDADSLEETAKECYFALFEEESGILLLINDAGDLFIYSDGGVSELITESRISSIIEKTDSYSDSGNYYLCAKLIIQKLSLILETDAFGYRAVIVDAANLFSDEEITELLEQMQPIKDYCHVAVVTSDASYYRSAKECANDYYNSLFDEQNGTLFLIDMYNREVYICSDGETDQIISRSNALSITDNVYRLASKEKYYECSSKALKQILRILEGRGIARPMKYICNLLLALTAALSICFAQMSRCARLKQPTFKEILGKSPHSFKVSDQPEYIITHHTWEDISGSSGGGGYRGGRSSGGRIGGSRGGGRVGGGHRF